jgi:hypothetical protein
MKTLLLSVAVALCVAATPMAAEAQSRSFHAPWG